MTNPKDTQRRQAKDAKPGQPEGNQGEGNRQAARHYNLDQANFAKDKDKVRRAADEAKQAVSGPEGEKLRQAEREGRKPARG